MKKKISLFLLMNLFITHIVFASDSVDIPCKKIDSGYKKIIVSSDTYDSESGFDFFGQGQPKYFDPMYYNYYIDDPRYKLFYNYPTFFMPAMRKRK